MESEYKSIEKELTLMNHEKEKAYLIWRNEIREKQDEVEMLKEEIL